MARRRGRRRGASAAGRWARLGAAVVALLAVLAAGVAQAQLDAGQATGLDTDVTPIAKQTDEWVQLEGARFGERVGREGSVTPFGLDLFDVAFRTETQGLAGGALCRQEPDAADPQFAQKMEACERVPAVLRFEGDGWAFEELPGSDEPGFVGGVAWLDHNTALAVGGTGELPRREPNPPGAEWSFERRVQEDLLRGAGSPRAWLLEDGEWREMSAELPAGMRGLSALDAYKSADTRADRYAVAGAYGQLWIWRGDRFTGERIDKDSPPALVTNPGEFLYRVREVRIPPDPDGHLWVIAVTAGCCGTSAPNPATPAFRVIDFHPRRHDPDGQFPPPPQPSWGVSTGENTSSLTGRGVRNSYDELGETPYAFGMTAYQDTGNDFKYDGNGWRFGDPLLAPATPESDEEAVEESSFRLVAGDGDRELAAVGNTANPRPEPGDGVLDWRVGELLSADQGLGGPGLLSPLYEGSRATTGSGLSGECALDLQPGCAADLEKEQAAIRSRMYRASSYRLNAIDVIGPAGVGWAVGDRGAILKLDSTAEAARAEPEAPRLGARQLGEFGEDAAYDPLRRSVPDGSSPAVPSLAEQPRVKTERPRLVSYGTPDAHEQARSPSEGVRTIVMSEDGSEGWAIGPADEEGSNARLTLHHYEDGGWRRCDPVGVPGLIPPDPECEGIAKLFERTKLVVDTLKIAAAARIPTDDGDLEILAVGTFFKASEDEGQDWPVVIRYSGGRWRLEPSEARQSLRIGNTPVPVRALAISAPDEGWLIHQSNQLYRWDGKVFIDCYTLEAGRLKNQDACEDPENRMPGVAGTSGIAIPNTLAGADGRVYFGSTRSSGAFGIRGGPVILYNDAGEGGWRADGGGWDPGFDDPAAPTGLVSSFAVVRRPDGRYEGYAGGAFESALVPAPFLTPVEIGGTPLARLTPDGRWQPVSNPRAVGDYDSPPPTNRRYPTPNRIATLADPDGGPPRAFYAPKGGADGYVGRFGGLLEWDLGGERWEVAETGAFRLFGGESPEAGGSVRAMTPDGEGGVWLAVATGGDSTSFFGNARTYYYRYSDRAPRAVFEEAPHPVKDVPISSVAGAANGALWVATESDVIYRYDRVTGWDRARVPGWEPGRVVTRASRAMAVAAGPDGNGVAVGEGGRIAELSSRGLRLDAAAGTRCDRTAPASPCGTGRDLRAVAVAPDGSALAGGDNRTLLWRPAGDGFRLISPPPATSTATITGVALPRPDRAWAATSSGDVYAGTRSGESWSWRVETRDERDRPLSRTSGRDGERLNAIAIGSDGRGFAVGNEGAILERTGDGTQPWRRLDADVTDDLRSVTLNAGGGEGALIGGARGLVLTRRGGRFQIARAADQFAAVDAPVTALALVPGAEEGQTEAWAVVPQDRRAGTNVLLHYASEPGEPLLRAGQRVKPLPDAPAARPGELALYAFGRSDCHNNLRDGACSELFGSGDMHDLLTRRVRDEIAERGRESGVPGLALHTGDAYDTGGPTGLTAYDDAPAADTARGAAFVDLTRRGTYKFRRFEEQVLDPLGDAGVPVFGTVGPRDLSETRNCSAFFACVHTRNSGAPGENLAWREVLAGQPGGWGSDESIDAEKVRFEPVEDAPEDDPATGPSARTHYAVDVIERASGRKLARLVVADTSLRSLSASDPIQHPREPQATWLERMICIAPGRTQSGERCTRAPDQQAVVLTSTPTYAYGPGATDIQPDGAAFETLLLRHRVNLLVSGRLGWNGLYYTTAPGLHSPQPGGDYPETAPEPPDVSGGRPEQPAPTPPPAAAGALADALLGTGAPGLPPAPSLQQTVADQDLPVGVLPSVVAASAGGTFGPYGDDDGDASEGFWRGYTVARLDASGDPRRTVVEQRPIFDWLQISATTHVLRPGQRMSLRGEGRSPIGQSLGAAPTAPRFERIDSPAITHRYDLLEADPDKPYLPREDADGRYVPLDPTVATVDSQTGRVTAGRGNHPRAFAIGLLSVGKHSASYPLVFEPRRSFVPREPSVLRQLPVRPVVLSQPPAGPPPPPPPPAPTSVASVQPPVAPPPPAAPPLAAPPVPPSTPPAPPAPPAQQAPTPIDLAAQPVGLTIAPAASVIPPPAPPIQPAPPGGARREARQRQAATAKSEEGPQQGVSEGPAGLGGDAANGPPVDQGSAFARGDRTRPHPSFTPVSRSGQPSTWSQGALYAGTAGLMAFALATGWTLGRPGPRRRPSPVPAPARCSAWQRRR